MATYQVTRLSIIFDGKSGRLQALRTRPGGFALPIYEAEFDIPSSELSSSYQVGTAVGQIQHAFGTLTARDLLVIHTTWAGHEQKITRTFRTLQRAFVQRVEIFDFHYQINRHGWAGAMPLLRFNNLVAYDIYDNGFHLQTVRYQLHARVKAEGIAEWLIEELPDSNEAILTVRGEGDCELRVSFGVHGSEKKAQEPSVHFIPAPLDEITFLSTALAPTVRAVPLSREPRFNIVVSSPAIFYMSSESVLGTLHPKGSLFKRLWPFGGDRDGYSVALPPRNYPLGSLIRMSDILIYRWREDIPDLLGPLIAYLRGLGENQLASLQRIVVVSDSDRGTKYFQSLKGAVGKIQLPRAEPSNPEE